MKHDKHEQDERTSILIEQASTREAIRNLTLAIEKFQKTVDTDIKELRSEVKRISDDLLFIKGGGKALLWILGSLSALGAAVAWLARIGTKL